MNTPKTILVTLSGDEFQSTVIKKSLALTEGKNISIIFLHVVKELGLELFRIEDMIDTEALKAKLDSEIKSYDPKVPYEIKTVISENIAETILKEAEELDVEMLVIGTSKKSFGFGSVARKLLQDNYLPVFVIKNEKLHDNKVLHPLDLRSEIPEIDCEICNELIDAYEQHYIYGYDGLEKMQNGYENLTIFQSQKAPVNIEKCIQKAKARFSDIHPDKELELLEIKKDISSELLEYAKDNDYNLITMTSKHCDGLASIIFGSVAAKIAKTCEADLLITYSKVS